MAVSEREYAEVCRGTVGTCDDARCPLHGWCHDGCGQRTPRADQGRTGARMQRRHMPFRFLRGHSPGSKASLRLGPTAPHGIPAERLRPLVLDLVDWYGGWKRTAKAAGVSYGTLYYIVVGHHRHVHHETAARLWKAADKVDNRHQRTPMLDPAPLRAKLDSVNASLTPGTALYRAAYRPLSIAQADRIACALGFHPSEVWPEWDLL